MKLGGREQTADGWGREVWMTTQAETWRKFRAEPGMAAKETQSQGS